MQSIQAIAVSVLLLLSSTDALGEQVLTIYFCGTGATSEWYTPQSKLGRPELLASLYKMDQSDIVGQDRGGSRHKVIINGVGTGSGWFLDLLATIDPSELGRGWTECLSEAHNAIAAVINGHQGEELVLNLVGWSRGGILCMKAARELANHSLIQRINILALDPVPGAADAMLEMGPSRENSGTLPAKVNHYVGIYAQDERSYKFEPVIPDYSAATKAWLFSVPGSHETLVGSCDRDGKSIYMLPLLPVNSLSEHGDLRYVCQVSNAVAQTLLGSPEWGNVEFGHTDDFTHYPVYPEGVGMAEFNSLIDSMALARQVQGVDLYEKMHGFAFTPLGWGTYILQYELTGRDHHLLTNSVLPVSHSRLCFVAPHRHNWELLFWEWDQVYWLPDRVRPITTEDNRAWIQLLALTHHSRPFIRGDCNDDGTVDLSDPVFNLEHQFLGRYDPDCLAALDTNADGAVDLSDPIYNLEHQFLGRPAPLAPYPDCGPESLPPARALPCDRQPAHCP